MQPARPPVAIVGAGVAGLVAAHRLQTADIPVTILEARSRVGGRIDTRHDFAPGPIERGAEFVHGQHPVLLQLVEGAGLALDRRGFERLVLRDGEDITSTQSRERVFEELASPDARDIPIGRRSAELVDRGAWSPQDAQLLHRYVEGYMAADVARVSALALSEEARAAHAIHDDFNFSVREGYDALVGHLAKRLDGEGTTLDLDAAVHRVQWQRSSVVLHSRRGDGSSIAPVHAARAIFTVPLSILQLSEDDADAIRFEPVPGPTLAAARALAMGHVIKMFLRFRVPFPELPDVRGEIRRKLAAASFVQTPDGAVPTWWRIGDDDAPVLVGWAGGAAADRLAAKSDDEIVAAGIETLSRALGTGTLASSIRSSMVANWQRERWSRGAYSWIPAGALDAPAALAAPVEDTLFFAGEATDTAGYRGTVHGAIVTGLRAAREIESSLR